VLSVGGRQLTPRLPAGAIAWVEAPLALLPQSPRRFLVTGLAAVKVVAVK